MKEPENETRDKLMYYSDSFVRLVTPKVPTNLTICSLNLNILFVVVILPINMFLLHALPILIYKFNTFTFN